MKTKQYKGRTYNEHQEKAAFTAHVGPSVSDRMREGGGIISMDWESFRGKTKGEGL